MSKTTTSPTFQEPFHRTIVQLYDFFSSQTSRPYRYAGAITSYFGMHPKLCTGCDYLRAKRKDDRQRKDKGLPTSIREGVGLCKINDILKCPKHKTVRETLIRVMVSHLEDSRPQVQETLPEKSSHI